MSAIALVGMACRYPDAHSPQALWENVLAQRQAFRRFPAERLHIEDYFSPEKSLPDTTYATQGAFIEGYAFDRVRFRISGSTYRASDLTHWLALDVAAQALADAGFTTPESLPADSTGVILGNTLTGEFSRANGLRLRWPYVRRVIEAALQQEGWTTDHLQNFLSQLEGQYKAPFTPVGEETLAGGLSNTIAGRICNYFNLKGGGYTVDGACASSLLATVTACTALDTGEIDLALAGGVDLSMDPFEIVGFAKTSALAPDAMRVYDTHSQGFIPGEGCGFVVLMRYEDAVAQQRRIYALIRGWGISSDGSGGITRPETEGQLFALTRAYRKASVGIDSVVYFEGHGTGTNVGDATELSTLSQARRAAISTIPGTPATIGSIKANIGHTKAASGVAGLIKASMALFTQVIPPTTGVSSPHAELTNSQAVLQVTDTPTPWPAHLPLRAGVSAMGFGGINTHLVLEGLSSHRRTTLSTREQMLGSTPQDAEILLFSSNTSADLQQQIAHLRTFAARLSLAELTDLSIQLLRTLTPGLVRAAVVASNPTELTKRLASLESALVEMASSGSSDQSTARLFSPAEGVFLGQGQAEPRIGLLFSGQGSPVRLHGGLFQRRFDFVANFYRQTTFPACSESNDTRVAQPAIVAASLAGLHILERLGIGAQVGLGHSLGELTALHWAGAFDETTLLHLATMRGHAMSSLGNPTGKMLSLGASQEVITRLMDGLDVVIAGLNTPAQTVVSGEAAIIAALAKRAQERQIPATYLNVSHAFHSPLVAAAVPSFVEHLAQVAFQPLQRPVASTVTGGLLEPAENLEALLSKQITSPVRFMSALQQISHEVDLLIEVGPGQTLSRLAAECTSIPALSLDVSGTSLTGLLKVVGAAFALGCPLKDDLLSTGRFSRPFDLAWQPRFFANPCEQAPLSGLSLLPTEEGRSVPLALSAQGISSPVPGQTTSEPLEIAAPSPVGVSTLELVRQLVAHRVELPLQAVSDASRMLTDLHLNSITVGQLVSEAARALSLLPPVAPTEYADASVAEIAQVLESWKQSGRSAELAEHLLTPSGIDTWIRPFQVAYVEQPLAIRGLTTVGDSAWRIIASPDAPLASALQESCARLPGTGVLVCLPPHPQESDLSLLLQGTQEALRAGPDCCFALVQHSNIGGASIARSLYLETPARPVCVVDVPPDDPRSIEWVLTEIQQARNYTEVCYTSNGERTVPTLTLVPWPAESLLVPPLDTHDVLLVSGGGKGIASECALALAKETGVRLALLGRSQPEHDQELARNLSHFEAAGIQFVYLSVDVTRADAVRQAVCDIERDLGPVTAVLHAAGANTPRLLGALNESDLLQTLKPKVQGLQHILAALQPERLRLLVTFGSVIARTGMRGEADYALANDWLAILTETFQAEHPDCRCLCLEWSVWSGLGMGERLGSIDSLMREGIMPIPLDQGVACFQRLLKRHWPCTRLVVTSRFGTSRTLRTVPSDLPFLRFLEQLQIHYPQIELVVDSELSTAADLYLEDHKLHGERLLPAVVGLEAMAQAAMALVGAQHLPRIEQVQLVRPVVIPARASAKIRIVALVRDSGSVEVALRCEESAFQVDHFRATYTFGPDALEPLNSFSHFSAHERLTLNPATDLYGHLLFHEGHFQRIAGYRHLRATECIAEITPGVAEGLFAHYLPSRLVLGDFTARDALIHAIQACIPHARLLPIAVEEIRFAPGRVPGLQGIPEAVPTTLIYARERAREGDLFLYDVEVRTSQGEVVEQWRGLQLRQVEVLSPPRAWHEALLGPYLERKVNEIFPTASLQVVFQHSNEPARHARSNLAFQSLLGAEIAIERRLNGKPVVLQKQDAALSASHYEQLTLAVTGAQPCACDVEVVASRSPQVWQDLLGVERFHLASFLATQEELHIAATRAWAAGECLSKLGAMPNAPLLFDALRDDGWLWLRSGSWRIATYAATLQGRDEQMVFAVCANDSSDPQS